MRASQHKIDMTDPFTDDWLPPKNMRRFGFVTGWRVTGQSSQGLNPAAKPGEVKAASPSAKESFLLVNPCDNLVFSLPFK